MLFATFCRVILMSDRKLLFATICSVVFDQWQKSVVRNKLQSCVWWVTEIWCSQHSAELFLINTEIWCSAEMFWMSDIILLFATFCRVVFDEWQKYVVRNILKSCFAWVTEICCSNILQSCFWWVTKICCSAELFLMSDIILLFATFCRVVFDEWQKSVIRNIVQCCFDDILEIIQCCQCWRKRAGALYCRLCNDCLLDTFIGCVDIRHNLTSRLLKFW
jgi:hypothetical protein